MSTSITGGSTLASGQNDFLSRGKDFLSLTYPFQGANEVVTFGFVAYNYAQLKAEGPSNSYLYNLFLLYLRSFAGFFFFLPVLLGASPYSFLQGGEFETQVSYVVIAPLVVNFVHTFAPAFFKCFWSKKCAIKNVIYIANTIGFVVDVAKSKIGAGAPGCPLFYSVAAFIAATGGHKLLEFGPHNIVANFGVSDYFAGPLGAVIYCLLTGSKVGLSAKDARIVLVFIVAIFKCPKVESKVEQLIQKLASSCDRCPLFGNPTAIAAWSKPRKASAAASKPASKASSRTASRKKRN